MTQAQTQVTPLTPLKQVIIFGAGKTGRGLGAYLCQQSQLPYVLVDNDQTLLDELQEDAGVCRILDEAQTTLAIDALAVVHNDDPTLEDYATVSDLWLSAVFGENLPTLAKDLSRLIAVRQQQGCGQLQILTCENLAHAASVLREACEREDPSIKEYMQTHVRFIEGIVLKTCLYGETRREVLAQDFAYLPCDADAFFAVPAMKGLQPLHNFEHQLQRKIYTYNAINAVISYLGARSPSGYEFLSEAANDPAIAVVAEATANTCNAALIAEFNFDPAEQQQWSDGALAKFSNPNIPDPISRNVAAVRRKLARGDRLLAPALLALKHGIDPAPLLTGIVAALHFVENGQSPLESCQGDWDNCLEEYCGLAPEHALAQLIHQKLAIERAIEPASKLAIKKVEQNSTDVKHA